MTDFNSVPLLQDLPPLDNSDRACMADLYAVLERHGKADAFTVGRLHRHFDIAPGERLVEVTDEAANLSTTLPVPPEKFPQAKPSSWRLTAHGPKPLLWCYTHLNAHS